MKYEIQQAKKLNMGRFIIRLDGMRRQDGSICGHGPDPYQVHGLYSYGMGGYVIEQHHWLSEDGQNRICYWIEDAIERARLHHEYHNG